MVRSLVGIILFASLCLPWITANETKDDQPDPISKSTSEPNWNPSKPNYKSENILKDDLNSLRDLHELTPPGNSSSVSRDGKCNYILHEIVFTWICV